MIHIKHLAKSFGPKAVLKDINLNFDQGMVYGIVGANGAGKTTLFKCIAGLYHHTGTIESEYKILKNQLGFLETDPYFLPKITGREYLQFLCNARQITIKDIDSQNIFDLPLDQYASIYSSGMQKKLAFLGVMLQQNPICILDEPFNGVDIQSNLVITSIIEKLRENNKLIIISSHIFSTLKDICDEIILLKDGVVFRKVLKSEFDDLESQMKDFSIGNIVNDLQI